MLPAVNPQMTPERVNFPTKWQAVIFRNYRMVPTENIARNRQGAELTNYARSCMEQMKIVTDYFESKLFGKDVQK